MFNLKPASIFYQLYVLGQIFIGNLDLQGYMLGRSVSRAGLQAGVL